MLALAFIDLHTLLGLKGFRVEQNLRLAGSTTAYLQTGQHLSDWRRCAGVLEIRANYSVLSAHQEWTHRYLPCADMYRASGHRKKQHRFDRSCDGLTSQGGLWHGAISKEDNTTDLTLKIGTVSQYPQPTLRKIESNVFGVLCHPANSRKHIKPSRRTFSVTT